MLKIWCQPIHRYLTLEGPQNLKVSLWHHPQWDPHRIRIFIEPLKKEAACIPNWKEIRKVVSEKRHEKLLRMPYDHDDDNNNDNNDNNNKLYSITQNV